MSSSAAERQNDDDRRPSSVVDDYWLYAYNPNALPADEEEEDSGGKWLVFVPIIEVDTAWGRIRRAVIDGHLGDAAKVATAKPSSLTYDPHQRVICVYTSDWTDEYEVRRVHAQLFALGFTWRMSYKRDEETRQGVYRKYGADQVSVYRFGRRDAYAFYAGEYDHMRRAGAPEVPTLRPPTVSRAQASLRPASGPPWTYPHIPGQVYQPYGYPAQIDAYTASYIRWRDREHVLSWLASFDDARALRPVFIDTETTGSLRYSQVIEISLLDEHGQQLFHTLLNPTTPIEPIATSIHGLTHKDVADAPLYPAIHEELVSLLDNRVIIAYNAAFDLRLLKQTAEHFGLPFPQLHVACLFRAYSKYRSELKQQADLRLRYAVYRLEEALAHEGISSPVTHRALQDAHGACLLFRGMASKARLDANHPPQS